MAITMRPFTDNDWFGYAGAVPFDNGEPLRGEIEIEGNAGYVVVDAEGAGVSLYVDDIAFEYHVTGPDAYRAVMMLEPEMTRAAFEALGWELVSREDLNRFEPAREYA